MSDYKILLFNHEARKKLAAGADKLAKAVVSTLGPLSRNVAINREYPGPIILHDGVSVAREIRLEDPFEDMGAVLLREASSKTNDLAGDGTTTATLLGNTLLQEGLKMVGGGIVDGVIAGNSNPMVLKKIIDEHVEKITSLLDDMAIKLEKREDYEKVATISSGSKEIGKLVADAIERVGKDGVIMVENDASFNSSLEIQEGMEFENGYLSPYFVTDPDRMICEYSDGYVLLTDFRIADAMQLVPIVEKVIKDSNKPLIIIADDVVGPALQALVLTKMRTKAQLVAVVAPEYADKRKEMLEDIAVLTGGTVIAQGLDKKLEDVQIADLGRFRNLTVTQTHTTITPKHPDNEEIQERVNAIKKQMKEEKNDFRKQRLEYRLGKISGGVAILKVGGSSETEIREKRERVIDAVHATKAALSDGVIPGGGYALWEIAKKMKENTDKGELNDLVVKVLESPFRTLMENSGEDIGKVLELINVLPDTVKNRGYDVVSRRAGDLVQMGVIDPVKVTKSAVRFAFSVAGMMLTTDTLISDDREEDRKVQKVKPI